VLQGQGMKIADAVRQIGITQQTYYRWRKEYGGMNRDQLKRLKELEKENARLALTKFPRRSLFSHFELPIGHDARPVRRSAICSQQEQFLRHRPDFLEWKHGGAARDQR
jgi:transposase-like protein